MTSLARLLGQPRPAALALALATLALFAPVATFDFLNYDDGDYVTKNAQVLTGLNARSVAWAFTSFHAQNWHPLTWLSLMLDVTVIGPNPGAMHLVNAFLHAVNSALLFLLFRTLTGAHWRSLILGALFAWHPLHVESVAWISERKDVLSTLFLLLTLRAYAFYVRGSGGCWHPRANYGLALAWFALGLMSKPMLVTLPFLLLLLDGWPLERLQHARPGRVLAEKIPFFVLTAASCVVTFVAQRAGGAVRSLEAFPLDVRAGNAVVAYVAYLGKMVWPHKLSVLYPHPGQWSIGMILGALVLLVAITALAVAARRRTPEFLFGWLWYLGTLVPVIGLVQVGIQAMADRYTYVPSIGIFVSVVWGLGLWMRSRGLRSLVPWCVLLIAALALRARDQLAYWRNDETLFRHAVSVTSGNAVAHYNLADALLGKGRAAEALPHYQEVIRLTPQYPHAYNNAGTALVALGLTNQAVEMFTRALEVDPRFVNARLNLADSMLMRGRTNDALAHLRAALAYEPQSLPALLNLARTLQDSGDLDGAVALYRRTLAIVPLAGAYYQLGQALAAKGDFPAAAAAFRDALRLNPELPGAAEALKALPP